MPARCLSSGYSPLFTWALLHASPEATALPHLDEDASDYGITPQSGKRNGVGLQSFLYLDLAGSSASPTAAQTQRSGRQTHSRRKTSTLSRSTSWTFCTSELHSDLRREMLITFETPKRVTPIPPKRAAPVVSWRPSRESLRNIPSPKPAPLTSLPDPPVPSASGAMTVPPNKLRGPKSQPPSPSLRLSPLLIQKSTKTAPPSPSHPRPVQLKRLESPPYLSLTPSTSSSLNVLVSTPRSSRHRASQSVPSAEHDSSLLSPTSSLLAQPAFSGGRLDSSIASSTKMRSRVDALACLEGKGRSEPRRACADQCIPNSSHLFAGNQARSRLNDNRRTRKRLSLSPARSAPIFLSGSTLASASASSSSLPATSLLTPAASPLMSNIAAPPATTTSASHRRKRRSTAESWFPLRSFIDLKTESDERVSSWKWRSFIEVGVA
ncbi:hypothetical protein EV401DRAFT_1952127 [Pisolithus croceorrhizus]|nr:hypothetical protein EV401DRAFT_1952127 [Pisolithus croceorrhizus]